MFSRIVFDSLDIRQHLGQLLAGDISSELQRAHLVGCHGLRVVHRALADRLEIGQQTFCLDLLTQRLPARSPPVMQVSVPFVLTVSHLARPQGVEK